MVTDAVVAELDSVFHSAGWHGGRRSVELTSMERPFKRATRRLLAIG